MYMNMNKNIDDDGLNYRILCGTLGADYNAIYGQRRNKIK